MYSCFERGCGFVLASLYSPILLEFFEEVFNQMTSFIQEPVIAGHKRGRLLRLLMMTRWSWRLSRWRLTPIVRHWAIRTRLPKDDDTSTSGAIASIDADMVGLALSGKAASPWR